MHGHDRMRDSLLVRCRLGAAARGQDARRERFREQDHVIRLKTGKRVADAKSLIGRVYENTGHAVLLGFTENEQSHSVCFRPCGSPSVYRGAVHSLRPHISESVDWPRIVNGHTLSRTDTHYLGASAVSIL